jgi:hypothetical protein
VIKGILGIVALLLVSTFPATWLMMLFIGNIAPGIGLGYWGTLPLGIMVSSVVAGTGSSTVYRR